MVYIILIHIKFNYLMQKKQCSRDLTNGESMKQVPLYRAYCLGKATKLNKIGFRII